MCFPKLNRKESIMKNVNSYKVVKSNVNKMSKGDIKNLRDRMKETTSGGGHDIGFGSFSYVR